MADEDNFSSTPFIETDLPGGVKRITVHPNGALAHVPNALDYYPDKDLFTPGTSDISGANYKILEQRHPQSSDIWSTVLPAALMAGIGSISAAGALGGGAEAVTGGGSAIGGGGGAGASSAFLDSLYPSLGIEGNTAGGITGLGTGAAATAPFTMLPNTLPSWATPQLGLSAAGTAATLANATGGQDENGVSQYSTGVNDTFNSGNGTASSLNTMTPEQQARLQALGFTPADIARLGGTAVNTASLLGSDSSPVSGADSGLGADGETEVPLTEVGGKTWLDSLLDPKNLLTAGLALGAAGLTSNAASKAADAQIQAAQIAAAQQKAIAEQTLAQQKAIADQIRSDQEPFRQAGIGVLPRLTSGLSPDGELTRKFTTADRDADPVYQSGLQFGLDRGTAGINQRAISGGQYDSGATLKALTMFGNDYGTTKAGESRERFVNDQTGAYNKLAGVAGFGQAATNQVNAANTNLGNATQSVNMNLGNALSGLTTDAGNSRAANIVGGTNAWGSALGNIANSINGTSSDKILRALLGSNYANLGIA